MTVEEERRNRIAALDQAIPALKEAEAMLARRRARLERERSQHQALVNRAKA